jgi:phosphatidylinositol alpha-1,6-mannosyltransferase
MKILIVTSNYPRWANDTTTPFVHNFAKELVNNGHQVRVLAPHFENASIKENFEGVEIRRFRYFLPIRSQTVCYQGGALGNLSKNPFNKLKLPMLVGCELLALIKELILWKPDIVNSHWLLPQGFVAALACKIFKVKHIATVHGGDVFALNSPFMKKLKAFTINNSALVTVNSSVTEKVTKELAPHSSTPLVRIPTGILPLPKLDKNKIDELRENLKQSDDEKLILFVGRLSEEKGVREIIQATLLLLNEDQNVRLIVIGEGHEKLIFQNLAKKLNIEHAIDFIGWVENKEVYSYFSACDVFVGPSKKADNGQVEAQGLTFVEAMLAGCPVIGSNSGGIPDAVQPEKTGWLVEPGDANDIKEKITFIIQNTEAVQRITKNAKQFAMNNYLIKNSVHRFESSIKNDINVL